MKKIVYLFTFLSLFLASSNNYIQAAKQKSENTTSKKEKQRKKTKRTQDLVTRSFIAQKLNLEKIPTKIGRDKIVEFMEKLFDDNTIKNIQTNDNSNSQQIIDELLLFLSHADVVKNIGNLKTIFDNFLNKINNTDENTPLGKLAIEIREILNGISQIPDETTANVTITQLNPEELRKTSFWQRHKRKFIWGAVAVGVVAGGILVGHFVIVPLIANHVATTAALAEALRRATVQFLENRLGEALNKTCTPCNVVTCPSCPTPGGFRAFYNSEAANNMANCIGYCFTGNR